MVLDLVKKRKEIGGVVYYSVTEFHYKATKRDRAISALIGLIPPECIYKQTDRGRDSCTMATEEGLKKMISMMPRFPLHVKVEMGVTCLSVSETEFGLLLHGFLTELGIKYKTQYRIGIYCVDFFIPSLNLIVEHDEVSHKLKDETIRDSFLSERHLLMKCEAWVNTGIHLAKILTYIK